MHMPCDYYLLHIYVYTTHAGETVLLLLRTYCLTCELPGCCAHLISSWPTDEIREGVY
jgi:hypothetical protein